MSNSDFFYKSEELYKRGMYSSNQQCLDRRYFSAHFLSSKKCLKVIVNDFIVFSSFNSFKIFEMKIRSDHTTCEFDKN